MKLRHYRLLGSGLKVGPLSPTSNPAAPATAVNEKADDARTGIAATKPQLNWGSGEEAVGFFAGLSLAVPPSGKGKAL